MAFSSFFNIIRDRNLLARFRRVFAFGGAVGGVTHGLAWTTLLALSHGDAALLEYMPYTLPAFTLFFFFPYAILTLAVTWIVTRKAVAGRTPSLFFCAVLGGSSGLTGHILAVLAHADFRPDVLAELISTTPPPAVWIPWTPPVYGMAATIISGMVLGVALRWRLESIEKTTTETTRLPDPCKPIVPHPE